MKFDLLRYLRCPFCGGALSVSLRDPEQGDEIEHGLLTCCCGDSLVLGGIPIFKKEGRLDALRHIATETMAVGPDIRVLTELVRAGRYEDALLLLLAPPAASLEFGLEVIEILPHFRARLQRLGYRLWLRQARKARELFLDRTGSTTALDIFDFYYHRAMQSELYEYFAYRFAEPRYLGAVSLATLLPTSPLPVLDLACGFGHLLHYLTVSNPGHGFVGADRNFFQLYAAKRWIAPAAEFICCDGDERLPFATGSFGGILCSDAFHCFPRKAQCAEEMKRILEERGVVIIARTGNAKVEWKEGFEVSPEGYRDLFSDLPMRILSERTLVHAYWNKMGPQLADQAPLETLADEKWLSFVATRREDVFQDYPAFASWPHGVGRPGLNPLYKHVREEPAGGVTLEVDVPGGRFPVEHPECRVKLPKRVTVDARTLAELNSGERTPSVERLVDTYVALGFPANYR